MDPELLAGLRAVVDLSRLRVLGVLAGGPSAAASLAAELGRPLAAVHRDLDALVTAGIVEDRGERFVLRAARLGAMAGALAALDRELAGKGPVRGDAWPHDGEPLDATLARLGLSQEDRHVLRSFLVDGRLVAIPVSGTKRDVVLRFLRERVFTEDRDYPEKEVNARLALFHPDVAALRRYLVDEGMVTRDASRYRRADTPAAGDSVTGPAAPPAVLPGS